jgi:hypothetical protein
MVILYSAPDVLWVCDFEGPNTVLRTECREEVVSR